MVAQDVLVRRVAALQFFGVLLVCINHLPITLTKGFEFFYDVVLYRDSAWLGLSVIFSCAGFLAARWLDQLGQGCQSRLDRAVAGVDMAFARYAFPLFVVCTADILFQSYNNVFSEPERLAALPLFATLTQTWIYRAFDSTTMYFPFSGSNISWLCSDLFFLTLLYVVGRAVFARKIPAWVWALLLVAGALAHVAFFNLLVSHADAISNFAQDRYGELLTNNPSSALATWLARYMPYGHVAEFFCGVALVRLVLAGEPRIMVAGVAGATAVLLVAQPVGSQGWMLGPALCGLACLPWGRTIFTDNGEFRHWRSRLVAARLEIFVLHILLFAPFTPAGAVPTDGRSIFFMAGRVGMASLFMVLVSVGVHEFGYLPLRSALARHFGIETTSNEAM